MRKIVAGMLGVLVVLLAASCGASGSSSTTPTAAVGALNGKTATEILTSATAAAQTAGTAHYVLSAVPNSQSIVGDASQTEGQQSVTEGSQHIQVIYVGGVAYVRGDAGGLNLAMGLTPTVAAKYANKWIAVHSTDSIYTSIKAAVLLSGTVDELDPTGTLTLTAPTTVAGRQAVGVKGGLPGPSQSGVNGTATLYVAASHPTVPLKLTATAKQGTKRITELGVFSDWGKPLNLRPPAGAIAYSSLPTK
jgi:hypothetical protein